MTYYNADTILYLNGEFVKASEAKIDLYSQSLHYGYSVFEGIRSYKQKSSETSIFKAEQHYDRLINSARLTNIPFNYTTPNLIDITYRLLEINNIQDAYIRPLIYAPANMSFNKNTDSYLMIAVWKMEPFLGDKLLRVMTSSYQRPNPKGFNIEAKVSGHYVNSILASQEAKANDFDEALLLDINGFVAEGPGANIFYENNGALYTPATGNILDGITRQTVIEVCNESNIPVFEKQFTVEDMSNSDAAFYCGTAAEVIGWQSLDNVAFKTPWNDTVSKNISDKYHALVTGNTSSTTLHHSNIIQQEVA